MVVYLDIEKIKFWSYWLPQDRKFALINHSQQTLLSSLYQTKMYLVSGMTPTMVRNYEQACQVKFWFLQNLVNGLITSLIN